MFCFDQSARSLSGFGHVSALKNHYSVHWYQHRTLPFFQKCSSLGCSILPIDFKGGGALLGKQRGLYTILISLWRMISSCLCFLFAVSKSSARPVPFMDCLHGWGRAGLGGENTNLSFLPRTKDFQSKGALGKEWSCDYGCAQARLFPLPRGEYIKDLFREKESSKRGQRVCSQDQGPVGPLWPSISTVICSRYFFWFFPCVYSFNNSPYPGVSKHTWLSFGAHRPLRSQGLSVSRAIFPI